MINACQGDLHTHQDLIVQFRRFAFDVLPQHPTDLWARVRRELSTRERLAALLEGELGFHGADTGYASHDFHAFAAKFPPQLPRVFIRGLTEAGAVVLDPMMGSGTTIVEAILEGRHAIGLDIDPLALRLTRSKTTPLDPNSLGDAGHEVVLRARSLLADTPTLRQRLASRFDERTQAFVDYWFLPSTQHELMALALAIEDVAAAPGAPVSWTRLFLELTFSSIIITKSGGVSRARDLAHSRPHLAEGKVPRSAIEQFSLRLRRNLAGIAQLKTNGTVAAPLVGDARGMPLRDGVIDLIVTSPPYANAIDYVRAHKFSLVWLGASIGELSQLRARYIGSERIGRGETVEIPRRPEVIVGRLAELDRSKASILRKYFVEMRSALGEMHRVLRNDSAAVMVVGSSMMRGIDVQTHWCLADLAVEVGFHVVGVVRRALDRNRRMMPARFGKKSDGVIEQRMHEEYVVGLLKD